MSISRGGPTVRTIISLDREDKAWIDHRAREQGTTMTALVRDAIRRLREEHSRSGVGFEELLERTSKLWKREDGLRYQRSQREAW